MESKEESDARVAKMERAIREAVDKEWKEINTEAVKEETVRCLIIHAKDRTALLERIENLREALKFYAGKFGFHHGYNDCTNAIIQRELNDKCKIAIEAIESDDKAAEGKAGSDE